MRRNPTSAPRHVWLIPLLVFAAVCAGSGRVEAAGPADAVQCPPPPKVVGPDGIPGTADDGWIVEDFDTERDGTPGISLDRFPRGTPGVLNDTIGVWVGTAPGGTSTLAGIACAGFLAPPVDPSCVIDPDNDMDWHIHCPAGACPNLPGHVTPDDGDFAYSGQNSLHWGHHFEIHSRNGDSTKFRQLAAFMTDPIHLTPVPDPGDLGLSFFHVAAMMDNNSYNLPLGQANDLGDVQIQVFDGGAPGGGQWGFWDRLAPFQNTYDHTSYIWSAFHSYWTYCVLTPTDTGTGGYAPRGVKETLCYPSGIWSHCGNARNTLTVHQCDGPGVTGSTGGGLWVESRFSLADYLGRTVRIRWIAESWEFDCCSQSYYQLGGAWSDIEEEDGWWVDDIKITGAVQYPAGQPAEHEVCNGRDDDCNGNVDDDIGPGTVSVVLAPPRLWPPNHRMVDVHATVTLDGGCPAACLSLPTIVLTAVSSDEPDDAEGGGDGNTVADIQEATVGGADFDLRLRAERDQPGDGRRYQLTYAATDCSGSTTVGSAAVFVPQDQNGTSEPVSVAADEFSAGTTLTWPAIPEAISYDVVRGNTANLKDAGESIDLGPVACIRSGSTEPTTFGYEDAEFPLLGEAYFYLVAYDDAWGTSGYGTASAAKPRIAGSGGCP